MLFRLHYTAVFCVILVLAFKDIQSRGPIKKVENLAPKSDLILYLEALERVVDFCGEHENDFDINLYFGLFLTNVNLKRALKDKHQELPEKLYIYIKDIIQKSEGCMEFFKYKINGAHDLRDVKYKSIFSLFVNTTTWINRLPKFNMHRLHENRLLKLEKGHMQWALYRKKVDDRRIWVPNPQQSDLCSASLASAEETQIGQSRYCRVLKSCYHMLKNGTDFGYALTHRLLLLQQAEFARGCHIFSEQEDRQMRRRFCSTAYQEAEYIAQHEYEIVDLLLEQVCLCALEGYTQFLMRSWLTKIFRFQTPRGCFSQFIYGSYKTPCSGSNICISKSRSYDTIDGSCNGHTTAVAAGALAIASRFMLEFYYD